MESHRSSSSSSLGLGFARLQKILQQNTLNTLVNSSSVARRQRQMYRLNFGSTFSQVMHFITFCQNGNPFERGNCDFKNDCILLSSPQDSPKLIRKHAAHANKAHGKQANVE
jgi:hypothetical protein